MLAAGTISTAEYQRLRRAMDEADALGRGRAIAAGNLTADESTRRFAWGSAAIYGLYLTFLLGTGVAVIRIVLAKIVAIYPQLGEDVPGLAQSTILAFRLLERSFYIPLVLTVVALTYGYGTRPTKAARHVYGRIVSGVVMLAIAALFISLCMLLWKSSEQIPWE